ncbi:MAG: protein-methionine-sulfoxide reductase catalytic subunit MsrP [Chthoniobacterales bacterium]
MNPSRSWELPDSAVTSHSDFLRRREFLVRVGMGLAGTALFPSFADAASLNSSYKLDGTALTKESDVTSYNNFYEWGLSKEEPATLANQGWKTRPWSVAIGGLCDKPATFAIDDLLAALGTVEQRNYRHRCVEAWSMVIPWDGYPLARLVDLAAPKPEAKYIQFTSFLDPEHCPGQRNGSFHWPYTEGLTIAEARHELAFLATGLYGKKLPNQNGAPIRLVVPWKYGFKGAKSIVKIDFVDKQPDTLWNTMAPSEYGFYANVNPEVDHPRWSQASERVIGGGFFSSKKPTLKFNGYEKEVAALYTGLDLKKNF